MRTLCVPLFLAALVSPWARAQTAPPPDAPVLTLQSAVQAALRHSPLLRAAEREADAQRGAVEQAGAWPNPALGIEQEEWQAGKVVAMKMGDQDEIDVVAHDAAALQRRDRGGAAIDQEIDGLSGNVEAGILPAAGAEGIAAADKLHLHRK